MPEVKIGKKPTKEEMAVGAGLRAMHEAVPKDKSVKSESLMKKFEDEQEERLARRHN